MKQDDRPKDQEIARLAKELAVVILRRADICSVLRDAVGADEALRIVSRIRARVGAGEANQIIERVLEGAAGLLGDMFRQTADGVEKRIEHYFPEENDT